jgi:hypothetical protein
MNASSKILMVCGFCISFGIYVSAIQQANWDIVDVGQQRSYYTQARMNANAGLYYVMCKMANPSWFTTSPKSSSIVFGVDTVYYTITTLTGLPSYEARVTITTKFSNVIARQQTIIKRSPLPTNQTYLKLNLSIPGPPVQYYSTWTAKQTYMYPYMLTATEGSL